MTLRLLAATDFHGATTAVERVCQKAVKEKVDLIVACGDITHFGSYELAEELLALLAKPKIPVFFVPGNCDPPELLKDVKIRGVSNLHGACEIQDDLCFVGIGGSNPGPFFTPNEFMEESILKILEEAYGKADEEKRLILVSHAPPNGTKVDVVSSGKHVGSMSIRKFIETKKPILNVCGHVHEARGIDHLGSTKIVNPGPSSRGYCTVVNVNAKVDVQLDVI